MRLTLAALVLLVLPVAASAAAQVQSRPTDPPLVTASNESWYQLREPIQFAGELYYPSGATIFFNGNTMVRVGHYNGVPLYADATVEPYSVVLVPITRGLMQPYQRPRRGELAGTTGSTAPGFPVAVVPQAGAVPMAAVSPTAPPLSPGAIGVYTPEPATGLARRSGSAAAAAPAPVPAPGRDVVGTTGIVATPRVQPTGPPIVSLRRPENNDGVWVSFSGERWVARGTAIPLSATSFVRVGEYRGFPVYARRELDEDVIYLPARPGFVTPYRLKE
jgi:hypothetical protein